MFRRLSIIGIEILLNLCCILVCVYHISGPSLVQESVILTDDVINKENKRARRPFKNNQTPV